MWLHSPNSTGASSAASCLAAALPAFGSLAVVKGLVVRNPVEGSSLVLLHPAEQMLAVASGSAVDPTAVVLSAGPVETRFRQRSRMKHRTSAIPPRLC